MGNRTRTARRQRIWHDATVYSGEMKPKIYSVVYIYLYQNYYVSTTMIVIRQWTMVMFHEKIW
ncbi:hypothetical protein SESBI_11863 [Sesbania bispinosa]|nr:hypothetical protein SESBI_11863 [Sesbania bispinosa]